MERVKQPIIWGIKIKLVINNNDRMCKATRYVRETKAECKKTNKLPPSLQKPSMAHCWSTCNATRLSPGWIGRWTTGLTRTAVLLVRGLLGAINLRSSRFQGDFKSTRWKECFQGLQNQDLKVVNSVLDFQFIWGEKRGNQNVFFSSNRRDLVSLDTTKRLINLVFTQLLKCWECLSTVWFDRGALVSG